MAIHHSDDQKAAIDNEIMLAEDALGEIEALLSDIIERRDAQRQRLDHLKHERERVSHAAAQACKASGKSTVSLAAAEALQNGEWSAAFDWDDRVRHLLNSTFECDAFRPFQLPVINATLAGRDALVVMRTGGGKSLTYQLPAMLQQGLTLVVSPLLSLIHDQVRAMNLRAPGSAAALTSATDRTQAAVIYRAFKGLPAGGESRSGDNGASGEGGGGKSSAGKDGSSEASHSHNNADALRLVYVTPERVSKSKQLMAALECADKRGALTRFVVDEAHCCSQWGFDFRSDYAQLHVLKKVFPRVPLLALTATAPPKLASDVARILMIDGSGGGGDRLVRIRTPSNRPNIFYEVLTKPSSDADTLDALVAWMKQHGFMGGCDPGSSHVRSGSGNGSSGGGNGGSSSSSSSSSSRGSGGRNRGNQSGIVYCFSRKDADSVAAGLSARGVASGSYHAGCEEAEKERVHNRWLAGSLSVVAATVAFGLGIDKPDCRFVCHLCLPKSVEAFCQESGRAGRDGQAARAVLFFSPGDAVKMAGLCHSDRAGTGPLRRMQRFAMDHHHQSGRPCNAPSSSLARANSDSTSSTSSTGTTSRCRRRFLCRDLGDSPADLAQLECRETCDVCLAAAATHEGNASRRSSSSSSSSSTSSDVVNGKTFVDATSAAAVVLEALRDAEAKGKKLTFKQLADEAMKLGRKKAKAEKGASKKKKKTEKRSNSPSPSSFSSSSPVSVSSPMAGSNLLCDQASCEWLIAVLFLEEVLTEDFHYTAYSIIVYCRPGNQSSALEAGAKTVLVAFPRAVLSPPPSSPPSASPTNAVLSSSLPVACSSSSPLGSSTIQNDASRTVGSAESSGDVIVLDDDDDDDDAAFDTRKAAQKRPLPNKECLKSEVGGRGGAAMSSDEEVQCESDDDDDFVPKKKGLKHTRF